MRLEQGKLCLCIRKAEQSFKQLFSQKRAFSEHMEKWQDDDLYDMYDHNQFVPLLDDPTGKELEQAIAYQRQLGRGFLKIDTREKLDGDTGISLLCGISRWKTGRCLLCICDRWLCGDGCSCCKGSISQALRGDHTYETHCISV